MDEDTKRIPAGLESNALKLVKRANRLIEALEADVSDAEQETEGTPLFQSVANAYERLARARQLIGTEAHWHRSEGEALMEQLWELRQQLDKSGNAEEE